MFKFSPKIDISKKGGNYKKNFWKNFEYLLRKEYMKKFIITEEDRKHIHSLYGRILSEGFNDKVEELDNWIEEHSDYISEYSLKEMVEELFGGILGDVESHVHTEKDSGGDEYGENWGRKLITITNNGEPLIKVWVTNDYRYDFGKNSIEFGFGERFKFNQDSLY